MADGTGRLLRRYKIGPAFIETGTFDGSGIISGLRAGFSKIVTIELDDDRWRAVRDSFGQDFITDNDLQGVEITTLWGSSEWMLCHPIIRDLAHSSPTFMLDAHWSGSGTAGEPGYDPWDHELKAIAECTTGAPPFVIMLDDVEPTGPRGKAAVEELVRRYFPAAEFSFECGSHPQYYKSSEDGMHPWSVPGSEADKIKRAAEVTELMANETRQARISELLSLKQGYLSLTTHTDPSILVAVIK